jgi:hypothetical protein
MDCAYAALLQTKDNVYTSNTIEQDRTSLSILLRINYI